MSTEVGRHAEQVAARYLQSQGLIVLAQNWRTRWCEIDLVTRKGDVISFVEVKYRVSSRQGNGLDYITPQKLQQMQFAAEFWQSRFGRDNYDYRLAAIEVSGSNFTVTAWIDDL